MRPQPSIDVYTFIFFLSYGKKKANIIEGSKHYTSGGSIVPNVLQMVKLRLRVVKQFFQGLAVSGRAKSHIQDYLIQNPVFFP